MSFTPADSSLFGFTNEDWLVHLREAEARPHPGSLGGYELLGEAGRGGQGIVYRARQRGTGRDVALKRLLLGTFASNVSRHRFEREVEAVTALSHPGIVTVYGVDEVDGAPLLAMEWIEGEPITRWAVGRPLREVLAGFLQVCDALQHAHQHGVLHRDLKPSNVIVDRGGRARLLDFGLAKLVNEASSVSRTGEFLGTPAYAAPEQWRGEAVDARADVYSLGALLYELLTGQPALEGNGLAALVRAQRSGTPPRPSARVRSLSPELDAIVQQALRPEPAGRYQSVDALASDVRRFLSGEAVLAHPPSAFYLFSKLVARNRPVAALAGALVLATLLYAALATVQARRVGHERDRAVLAVEAEGRARADAEEARRRAEAEERRSEEALLQAESEREHARAAAEQADDALRFVTEDVMGSADPAVLGHEPTLFEILRAASPKASRRFEGDPEGEARVRVMLADAFFALGRFTDAEAEMRRALELRQAALDTPATLLAHTEHRLARSLAARGAYAEAEAHLRSAIARVEPDLPEEADGYAGFLDDLAALHLRTGRTAEAVELFERVLELDAGLGRTSLASRNNLAAALLEMGRVEEARAAFEATLDAVVAEFGEHHEGTAAVLANLASVKQRLGDLEGSEEAFRRVLAIELSIFGDSHPTPAATMGLLAQILAGTDAQEEAEGLARRGLAIRRAAAPGSLEAAESTYWLAYVLARGGDAQAAAEAYRDALALFSRIRGVDDPKRLTCLDDLGQVLLRAGQLDEAEEAFVELLECRRRVSGQASAELAEPLRSLARVYEARGDLEAAVEMLDERMALLAAAPDGRPRLAEARRDLAGALRRLGHEARATELEQRGDRDGE